MTAVNVPRTIRAQLRADVWRRADALDWAHLSLADKTRYYQLWAEDDAIGGLLAQYIDRGSVRHYLKESLLDDYTEKQQTDDSLVRRVLGISPDAPVRRAYRKPHGRCLADGRLVCWGPAKNWKAILMALYERSHVADGVHPYAAVLHQAEGTYSEVSVRSMVEEAATRLGIDVIKWL